MKKSVLFLFLATLSFGKSYAWGSKGHKIVAVIAKRCLSKSIIDSVQKYLGAMSFKDAAVWMDEVRSDKTYDYMKSWHYINVKKNETYSKNDKEHVVNEIQWAMKGIRTQGWNDTERKKQINFYLKVLFHLVGDIHQPLHCGYGEDKGANMVKINYFNKESNLHKVWDTEIIEDQIGLRNCLKRANKLNAGEKQSILSSDPELWMNECRELLPSVYSYNVKIDKEYVNKNRAIIELQLIKAGIRLAYILNQLFSK